MPAPDLSKDINASYRTALSTYSHHLNVPRTMEHIIAELEGMRVPPEVRAEFLRPLSMSNILFARKKLKLGKSYGDYPATVAHLMGPKALEIILGQFHCWAGHGGDVPHVTLVGLPTNKKASKENLLKYIQKTIRPIGISTLFRAWFQIAQQNKISKVVTAVASPNMYGFIPFRETHEMILQSLFRIEHANKRRIPLYGVKMDFSKCFDKIAHLLIEACDTVVGAGSTFQAIAHAYADTDIDIRISEDTPAPYHMSSGGPQGDARIPGIWAIISSTLARRLEAKTLELDASMLVVAALMFADDIILTAANETDLRELIKIVFDWAEEFDMPVEIKDVAANNIVHALKPNPKFQYEADTFRIARSMRALGACLHFCTNSPCPVISCPKCQTTQTNDRVCPACVDQCLTTVCSKPHTAVEKVAMLNGLLFGSMAYGAYTCTRQQKKIKDTFQRIRLHVQGPGYTAAAHLPAHLGGYGLHDTEMEIAMTTATMLDRILTRSPRTLQVIANYSDTLRDPSWPRHLMNALQPFASEEPGDNTITVRLHKSFRPSAEKSQAPLAEIRCQFSTQRTAGKDSASHIDVMTCSAQVAFSTSDVTLYVAHEETPASQYSNRNEETKQIITLAHILHEHARGTYHRGTNNPCRPTQPFLGTSSGRITGGLFQRGANAIFACNDVLWSHNKITSQ